MPRLAFYVRLADPDLLKTVGFYRDDLRALAELGFDAVPVTRVRDLLGLRADAIYAWWFGFGVFAMLWARVRGKPAILIGTVHSTDGRDLAAWPWHKRWLMKLALRLATRTIFISAADFARLGGARANHPSVIHCAVDLESHRPSNVPRAPAVVTISHLTRENVARKMVLESLEAFALFHKRHPQFTMHLVGHHGDAIGDIRARIAELGLTNAVDLPGRVSFEHKLRLLQTATAYLQPSRCEGFGLAILEAEACGCPVVTNHEPCIVEISGDAAAYGETPAQLADALSRLADDESHWRQMRERSLANARRYSHEARREKLREVLVSLDLLPRSTGGSATGQSVPVVAR
jgi:glycosyltransferase involved in cell wall biosynthesis